MHDLHLLTELAVALGAALAGGLLARLLRLPPLIGYLVAGIAIGPHTPGFIANEEAVQSVAKVGVALLMFAVGVQFSLDELAAVRRIALLGGAMQILGTVLLGTLVGLALGWGVYGGVFLGCAISLSSTAVMMRVLEERGELGSAHGSVMLGLLVVQDLTLVVMALILPSLAAVSTAGIGALAGVAASLLQAGVYLGVTLFLAFRGVPRLLDRIARTGSQELFLLSVVCICLAAAYLAHLAGFSLEIGAFLAGIVVTESAYAHEVFSQVRPLRDVFASLFFVSVGMLLSPAFVAAHWGEVLAVVLAILAGKALIAGLAVYALGCHGRTALLTGLGLAQIGEFSFVLAAVGSERKLIAPVVSSVILASALISLLLAPVVYGAAGPIYARLNRTPAVSRLLNRRGSEEAASDAEEETSTYRALILGGGRVGTLVSQALRTNAVPHVVVDYDAAAGARLHADPVRVLYGDATSEIVLREAITPSLQLAVVALPEAGSTLMTIRTLKQLAPEVPVVARVHRRADVAEAYEAGAEAVIYGELEVAIAMIHQGLGHLDFPAEAVRSYVDGVRRPRGPGGSA